MKTTILSLSAALLGTFLFSSCGGDAVRDQLINEALKQAEKAEAQAPEAESAPTRQGPVGGTELSKEQLIALLPETLMGASKSGELMYMEIDYIQTATQVYKQGEVTYTLILKDTYGSPEYINMDYSQYDITIGNSSNKSFKLSNNQHGSTTINNGPNPVNMANLTVAGRFQVTASVQNKNLSEAELIDLLKAINLSKLESLAM